MNIITTIDPAITGLDLRPLVALRAPAAELEARLAAGDRAAIDDAHRLIDRERDLTTAAEAALVAIGALARDRESARTIDTLHELIGEIGTGNLPFWLDVIEGRCPHPDEPDTEMLAYVDEHRDEIEAWLAPHRLPKAPVVELGPLVALRPDVEAMSLRLLAGDEVTDDEYRALTERHDAAVRPFVDGIVSAFTIDVDDPTGRSTILDGLTLAADRISGMWGLSAMWDDANAEQWALATTLRLLEAKRSEGAAIGELRGLYGELVDELTADARTQVEAWLASMEG